MNNLHVDMSNVIEKVQLVDLTLRKALLEFDIQLFKVYNTKISD